MFYRITLFGFACPVVLLFGGLSKLGMVEKVVLLICPILEAIILCTIILCGW